MTPEDKILTATDKQLKAIKESTANPEWLQVGSISGTCPANGNIIVTSAFGKSFKRNPLIVPFLNATLPAGIVGLGMNIESQNSSAVKFYVRSDSTVNRAFTVYYIAIDLTALLLTLGGGS